MTQNGFLLGTKISHKLSECHFFRILLFFQMSYEDQIRRVFFQPLSMRTAAFAHEIDRHKFENLAVSGDYDRGVWQPFDKNFHKVVGTVSPAGSICASAVDMTGYLEYLLHSNTTLPGAPPLKAKKDCLNSASNIVPPHIPGFSQIASKPDQEFGFGIYQYNLGTFRGVYRGKLHSIL